MIMFLTILLIVSAVFLVIVILTRNRPYRIKMSVADALNFMEKNSELYNAAFLREFIILMSKKNLTGNMVMQ